jgi:heptosyltransferase-3
MLCRQSLKAKNCNQANDQARITPAVLGFPACLLPGTASTRTVDSVVVSNVLAALWVAAHHVGGICPSPCNPRSPVRIPVLKIQTLRRRVSQSAMKLFFDTDRLANAGPTALPTQGIYRILICRVTHSLGNTLLLTPLIREIEAQYPGAEVDVLTRSTAARAIFGSFFSVRNVYCLPAWGFRHPLRFFGILRRIQRTQYDLVIDPCPQSQTGRLMLLLATSRFKLGFATAKKKGNLSHGVSVPASPRHVGQLPVFLLRSAIGSDALRPYPTLDLALSPSERQHGMAVLVALTLRAADVRARHGVIGIFANATGGKLLGSEWWRVFMRELEARYVDYSIVEIVPMFAKSLLDERYPAYYSSDIRKLACVLSGLSLFISADCGVMHLACASGAPVAGIFTGTDPDEWGPYGPNDQVIHAQGLPPEQVAERVAHNF